ncbi:hypothetical protein MNBD_ACTINO02-3126 [hydrothermal vent metagenome]|uniref:Uncharacterized protein n=1 Tax=hydrothermal vent metagenome TaxID=652676 RepID=A0A3B0S115_9ZZZZ
MMDQLDPVALLHDLTANPAAAFHPGHLAVG